MLVGRINDALDAYHAAFSALADARKALEQERTRAREEAAASVALRLYTAKGYAQGWLDAFAYVCPERPRTHQRLAEMWAETLRLAGDSDWRAAAQTGGDAS